MSRNKNQSNKRSKSTPAKPADKIANQASSEKEIVDTASVDAKNADAAKKTTEKVAENISDKTAEAKVADKNSEQKTDPKSVTNNKSADTKTEDKKSVADNKSSVSSADAKGTSGNTQNKDVNKKESVEKPTADKKPSPSEQAKTTPQHNKPSPIQTKPTPTLNKAQPQPKKKSGIVVGLALLLGAAGTGLGAYSFNELRNFKAGSSDARQFGDKLTALEMQISGLSQDTQSKDLEKQLADVSKQQKTLAAAEEKFNQRISEVEQMQKGLAKSVKSDIDTALKARMGGVDALLAKVKDIELGQQGLSKGLSQVNAGTQAVSSTDMGQQEVGYLLRMAHYKLQSEGDVLGATGLLKMAESKVLLNNKGESNELVDTIRAKIIQLSGVKAIDIDSLIGEIKQVGREIPQLSIKTSKPQESTADNVGVEKEEGMLGKIGSVIASGVKYTPNDPSKIDISAETILIEKRLMQADVRTAEFAVQSHNKVLLAQSVSSLKESLEAYFANDETAQSITKKLDAISQSELETPLPDLSGVVKQFEATQVL